MAARYYMGDGLLCGRVPGTLEAVLGSAAWCDEAWCEAATRHALAFLADLASPCRASDPAAKQAHEQARGALCAQLAGGLVRGVVLHLCRLTVRELELWHCAPEEWLHESEASREGLRCAAQTLLWALLKAFRVRAVCACVLAA